MAQDVIAIICDCDGTLCPDTSDRLVRELGLNSDEFWKRRVNALVEEGWDPPLGLLEPVASGKSGETERGRFDHEDLLNSCRRAGSGVLSRRPGFRGAFAGPAGCQRPNMSKPT